MKSLRIFIYIFLMLCLHQPEHVLAGPIQPGFDGHSSSMVVQSKGSTVRRVIRSARKYSRSGNLDKAVSLLEDALNRFPGKKAQKNLKTELAETHLYWADRCEEKYHLVKSIRHLEMAYHIDKAQRPEKCGLYLNRIGLACHNLGWRQKALGYLKKALAAHDETKDPISEARILNNLGLTNFSLGKNSEAMAHYREALVLFKMTRDHSGELMACLNIGLLHSTLGNKKQALDYLLKGLKLSRDLGDRTNEAIALNNIGYVYSDLGRFSIAQEYFDKATGIIKSNEDHEKAATLFNNMGRTHIFLGQYSKALTFFKKAMAIWENGQIGVGEAYTLNNIGYVYSQLGQEEMAVTFYIKALAIMKSSDDQTGMSAVFTNIGAQYLQLEQPRKAERYFSKALSAAREVGDKRIIAGNLNNMALVNIKLDRELIALGCYEEALAISQSMGDPFGEATTLNNIGLVYYDHGQSGKARDCFLQSLVISKSVGDVAIESAALYHLAYHYNKAGNKRLAVFLGKLAINVQQSVRSDISSLGKKINRSYLESIVDAYRMPAFLLINNGRLAEAQQVLEMLKVKEYLAFSRMDHTSTAPPPVQVDFTAFEKQLLPKYTGMMAKISGIRNEYQRVKFKSNKNNTENKRLSVLELKLNEARNALMTGLQETFASHRQELAKRPDLFKGIKENGELKRTLKFLDRSDNKSGKNAVLQYLVYDGHIAVIITTSQSQRKIITKVNQKEFHSLIMDYLTITMTLGKITRGVRIKDPYESNDMKKLIQRMKECKKRLYDTIFKPVEEELQKNGITNLMVSADGVLRYIPLTAMWDGRNYLLQKYRIVLITTSTLRNIKKIPVKMKQILAMGTGNGGNGFQPLPYVKREIRSIVMDEANGFYGLIKGKALIDDKFTKTTLIKHLKKKRYPMVHIASHFHFSPGDETKNHLLLGDGSTLKLSEIRHMGKLFNGVDLLVLSACQTAVGGNGEEIDGFGESAQQSGANCVVASLWPVADESTKDLMINFYRILKEGRATSKIEALRQAQLELAGLEDLLLNNKNRTHQHQLQQNKKKSKYAHPYYWGSFIMIGNWR